MSSTPEPGSSAHRSARRGLRAGVRAARDALGRVLDLAFPPGCVSCHGLVEPGDNPALTFPHETRNLCASCRRRIVIVQAPHCTTCGHPFFGAMAENIGCAHCETLRPEFAAGRTATLLQGPMRDIVHALKYRRAMHVVPDIAALIRSHAYFLEFVAGARLVPVPLHPRKRRERGYNQAELIATILAREAPGASIHPLLQRVVDTPTQTRLDREQRRDNLKNAFALATGSRLEPRARHVLVDDVFTTGATLNACATVLRRAGLTAIDVATLGHG